MKRKELFDAARRLRRGDVEYINLPDGRLYACPDGLIRVAGFGGSSSLSKQEFRRWVNRGAPIRTWDGYVDLVDIDDLPWEEKHRRGIVD